MFLAKFGYIHFSEALLTFGWSHPEQEWVWSEGKLSVVNLPGFSCQKCRLSLTIDVPSALGTDAIFRISVNGLDHGERRLATGHHSCVIEHEEPASSLTEGLVISFYHLTCRAPAEVAGGDGRLINIGLKELSLETLAPRRIAKIPQFLTGSPGDAYFAQREQSAWEKESEIKWRAREEIATRGPRQAVEFLLQGRGGNRHERQFVVEALQRTAQAAELKLNFLQGEGLPKAFVGAVCPEFAPCMMSPTGYADVRRTPIAEARANPLYDPKPLLEGGTAVATLADQKNLAEEAIFTHQGADLIAAPRQFMIFDRHRLAYFHGCNPAGLTMMSIDVDLFETDMPVVLVRDQFDAGNISHFLFDSCLRIMNFCEAFPALARQTLFVAGGTPGAFHTLAVEALRALYDIPAQNIVFPRSPVRLRSARGVSWFSDQVYDRHPCQRFRPEALDKLRKLVGAMQARAPRAAGRAKKIYISRSDAALRRLVNEDALIDALRERGFEKIVMSEHSWAEQIDIAAQAEIVVGPHGMGLTTLAFNLRQPRLIEIFNPTIGGGAYALMAKAYGMDYHAIAGHEIHPNLRDYRIAREEIDRILALVSG